MRQHPRARKAQEAHLALSEATNKIVGEFELTTVELMQILAGLQLSWLKYALRDERHPDDPDMPADVE